VPDAEIFPHCETLCHIRSRDRMAQDQMMRVHDSLRRLRGFVFDLDGTIWEGPRLLPGAADMVADLRNAGIGVMFASNCSRYGAGVLRDRLAGLGIRAATNEVVSAFDLVGDEIRRRLGPQPVLVVGTHELVDVLLASGHAHVGFDNWEQARVVVVGVDPDFSYDRLRSAARAVAAGAAFFAINLDARFPVGPGMFDPGCGSLSEAIAIAGGARPIPVGKPEGALFRVAISRLGCTANEAAMVGDSTASDIKGGRAAGMFTIWLNPDQEKTVPASVDLEVGDLAELHRLWREVRG
jgi:HAD superfamily hydrolase (TIGR01450 family)